jgi:hypothetical protein
MRRAVAAFAVAAAALLFAAPAQPATSARFGIMDDAWLLDGPGSVDSRVATLRSLGVGLVRFTLRWDRVAPSKPADPRDPSDSAYDWGESASVLEALHAAGIPTLVTIYGSPGWADGRQAPNHLPTQGIGDFAYAAAERFPWVRLWTAWNEPNGRSFSVPVSPSLYVTHVLNPVYAALHEANVANKVAGGVTAPRKAPSGMSPVSFMEGMALAHARLDAYAHNPYPLSPTETPTTPACAACGYLTLGNLRTLRDDVTRLFGPKPIWLTEYGYQTNPPDRLLGVAPALQARYLAEAALRAWSEPGVAMLIQFLVRDEPALGGWQSGLVTDEGVAKPAYRGFSLPLAEQSRRGSRVVLWGQVRPGSGRRAYRLQRSVGGTWRTVGATTRTGPGGTFHRTLTLSAGTRVRLFAPSLGYASPPLTIS